ncbi:CCR4-NOT transcription complex subunit 1 [Blomia tropicalis]|nr:CCR4-NOT transcription complex subunit 1 [Blomia tropicalis]
MKRQFCELHTQETNNKSDNIASIESPSSNVTVTKVENKITSSNTIETETSISSSSEVTLSVECSVKYSSSSSPLTSTSPSVNSNTRNSTQLATTTTTTVHSHTESTYEYTPEYEEELFDCAAALLSFGDSLQNSSIDPVSPSGSSTKSPTNGSGATSPSLNSLIISSCCRKCKNCYRNVSGQNNRTNETVLRLKEKTKKKKEAAVSSKKVTKNNSKSDKSKSPTSIMHSDESDDDSPCMHHHQHMSNSTPVSNTVLGRRSKSRTSSNDSDIICTLKVDCICKTCLQRQKLVDELIAEEESSKKKKAKKKKKKNAKKNQEAVEEEIEDDAGDGKGKHDTEDEDMSQMNSNGGQVAKMSNVVDPTSVDINQWIKVKNKFSGKLGTVIANSGGAVLEHKQSNVKSSSNSLITNSNSNDGSDEMESNGFKLIGSKSGSIVGTETFSEKRRNSNLENVTKVFETMSLDAKNGSTTCTNVQKAKLLAIDASMAYLRGDILDAIHLIDESIELDSKCSIYYINRSYYHEKNKEYVKAMKDAETAIHLEENSDEYLEYSLYRKAKALSGLERYDQVEQILNSIVKLLQHKSKNNVQVFQGALMMIEKDLLINRLKKLIASDYTLPLARLYALHFNSIQSAMEAIEHNCKIEPNGDNPINLDHHLRLINTKRINSGVNELIEVSKFSSIIKSILQPNKNKLEKPIHKPSKKTKQLSSRDLWNFNEFDNDEHSNLDDFAGGDVDREEDEHAFDDEGDDSDIYFSDDEEHEIMYSNPHIWNSPKDILQLNSSFDHFFSDEFRESINSKGQKALWIGNVSPLCSISLATNIFNKFGTVSFCKIFPNERTNEIAYLLLHYDNDISPRLVMAYFKDKVIPGISKDDLPLIIRFRNKNDKADEDGNITSPNVCQSTSGNTINTISPSSTTHHGSKDHHHHHGGGGGGGKGDQSYQKQSQSEHGPSGGNQQHKQPNSECYYWRTTGCDRERCLYKHIPAHKGIDKQSWMRRKN